MMVKTTKPCRAACEKAIGKSQELVIASEHRSVRMLEPRFRTHVRPTTCRAACDGAHITNKCMTLLVYYHK